MNTFMKLTPLAALLVAFAPVALATPITAGGAGVTPSITTAALYTGTLVGTAGGTITTPTFSADWTESVYSNAPGESVIPDCTPTSGCLDFVFNFTTVTGDALELNAQSNFLNFLVDAQMTATPGRAAAVLVDETMNGAVNWMYDSHGVADGKYSQTLVLYTDALTTVPGYFTLQDQTSGYQVDLGPGHPIVNHTSPVPEPGSLALLGTGLLTSVGIIRRKMKA